VAFGPLKDEVPGMPDEAPATLALTETLGSHNGDSTASSFLVQK
jgi:hypothetical protein